MSTTLQIALILGIGAFAMAILWMARGKAIDVSAGLKHMLIMFAKAHHYTGYTPPVPAPSAGDDHIEAHHELVRRLDDAKRFRKTDIGRIRDVENVQRNVERAFMENMRSRKALAGRLDALEDWRTTVEENLEALRAAMAQAERMLDDRFGKIVASIEGLSLGIVTMQLDADGRKRLADAMSYARGEVHTDVSETDRSP